MSLLPQDLKGQRFGLLTAIRYFGSDDQGPMWECRCICRRKVIRHSKELLRRGGFTASGRLMTCGCRQGDKDRIKLILRREKR
jgi:hypothetical protein